MINTKNISGLAKIINFLNNFYSLSQMQSAIHEIERNNFERRENKIKQIITTFNEDYISTEYKYD